MACLAIKRLEWSQQRHDDVNGTVFILAPNVLCYCYGEWPLPTKFPSMLIIDYNPDWIQGFEKINERLSGVLAGLCIQVEHIGSTAVPGLAAKPIIDIDIIYNEVTDFEIIKNRLCSVGYFHKGNQGVEGRDVFKRNGGQEDAVLDKITHHLYVCRSDCAELYRHLLFRDQLRKHETARGFYQHLKYEIAREAKNDRKRYAATKELKASAFINHIIESARIEFPTFGKIDC